MKHSIQKHNISNLSSLAPALRGLEDARTQRWTFCEPCSREQNVQVQGEDCQHGMTIEHVWENANMPEHRASKATVLTMSLDWEPHAKTAFPSQIVKHCENDSWQVHCQKKEAYKRNRNGKHSEAARSMKWAVVDMFAKARLAREKSAARWKNTKNIHLTSIFNISDQGPKKFPKWVLGISKWAFSGQAEGQEMPTNKYLILRTSNSAFLSRAQEMPNMSLGIGMGNVQMNFGSL